MIEVAFYGGVTLSMDKERATDISISVRPLTWYPTTHFSPNWKDMDLMGGLFSGQKRGQNLQLGLREQGEMALSSKRVDLEKEKFFYGEGGEALEQAVS